MIIANKKGVEFFSIDNFVVVTHFQILMIYR